MSFAFRSKRLLKLIPILVMSFFLVVFIFWRIRGSVWTEPDFQALDFVYRYAVQKGYGPKLSPQIVYLTITDNSYDAFGKNILDRADLARVNGALAELGVEAVGYDIIFARPSHPAADHQFAASIANLGSVYLPIGFAYSDKAQAFLWKEDASYERFRSDYLGKPLEKGSANPFFAKRALMQFADFSEAAFNSGHISAYSDPDGVYRHIIMLLKVDDQYFPTLSLSMFLNYVRVPMSAVIVDWGHHILIPAIKGSMLEKDVLIPIDERGRVFVPYAQVWDKGFKKMEAHALLKHFDNEALRGNLTEFFEGNFVFIGDISIGSSDLGQTPLESDAPLIILHASLMNGFLTNTFYHQWSYWQVIGLLFLFSILLWALALPKSSWILYLGGGMILAVVVGLTWVQFIGFSLFPVVTVGGSFLLILFGLIVGLEVATSKEQAFIRGAFSRYVPEKVVNELLANPELLQLGGEERVITVLFSDVANFTTISEKMSPTDLVRLLNEYLTEMTDLVLAEGGIIDKYEGDAIMGEFGAPLHVPDHADRAVRTGLKMQRCLKELRQRWKERGLPEIRCRVGINTGPMIVGNIGSNQVFDYTVIGDAVNLASRLEGANKRYGTYLMISESTYVSLTPHKFRTRVLDVIKVKGKTQSVKVFEVYGETDEGLEPENERYYHAYHEAFDAYLSREFALARERFTTALSMRPNDPACLDMITRIDSLDPLALAPDWDGSVTLSTK